VILEDASPSARNLAIAYGAGRAPAEGDAPGPHRGGRSARRDGGWVAAELARFPDALVTDVASVKVAPLESCDPAGAVLSRYLGTHPMAGRERGGAVSARADLFTAVRGSSPGHDAISYRRAAPIEHMILDLGAVADRDGCPRSRPQRRPRLARAAARGVAAGRAAPRRLRRALGSPAGAARHHAHRIERPALWVQILGRTHRPSPTSCDR
jgi:prephenate dehydrogenase